MPWETPTLKAVRAMTRDNVSTALSGAAMVGNSVLRVMSDAMGALAHLTLLYIDWLALQLLPDTAETEFLDRHGQIWLVNSDGSKGRKAASFASGTVTLTGIAGTIVPDGSRLVGANEIEYETTEEIILGADATPVAVRALDGGAAGNLDPDEVVNLTEPIDNVDSSGTVVELTGGADQESDADLRARVLLRIQQPPMGGDAKDYVQWALAVPGVTRAWCAPNEMGIGTVTVRFMCDDLRATDNGLPNQDDIIAVTSYLDTVRPVAVKDFWAVAPIPYFIDVTITGLEFDDADTRAAIYNSLRTMFDARSKPGQTMFASWVSEAISIAAGEDHHDLLFSDVAMPSSGHMPFLGSIAYV
jgi:uncharacterized phage protein gp47/JayE